MASEKTMLGTPPKISHSSSGSRIGFATLRTCADFQIEQHEASLRRPGGVFHAVAEYEPAKLRLYCGRDTIWRLSQPSFLAGNRHEVGPLSQILRECEYISGSILWNITYLSAIFQQKVRRPCCPRPVLSHRASPIERSSPSKPWKS